MNRKAQRTASLRGAALTNYLNFRNAECVGGDPAYAPLLEWLRRQHTGRRPEPKTYARLPLLANHSQNLAHSSSALIDTLIEDVLATAVNLRWWPDNGMLSERRREKLSRLCHSHGKRLYAHLELCHCCAGERRPRLRTLYQRFREYTAALSPRIRGLDDVLIEIDAMLRFYSKAGVTDHWLVYREFHQTPLEVLIQPAIDCCLFNGRSRHRAATVAFLAHPSISLMSLFSTQDGHVHGATVEADMIDESGSRIRVLDSIEIGKYRQRFNLRHGWIPLTVRGVIHRALHDGYSTVFFNTGYEESFDQGYLSHEAARELAQWLKSRFPVTRLRLQLQEGLEPLKKLGACQPKINLEILSTKKRGDMFNDGAGSGVGVRIDLKNPGQLEKLGLTRDTMGTFTHRFAAPHKDKPERRRPEAPCRTFFLDSTLSSFHSRSIREPARR